jgi:hypothetical protein
MSWSINTVWQDFKHGLWITAAALCFVQVCWSQAGELRAPSTVVAGNSTSISSTGSGSATLYLFGPGVALKRDVTLGNEITISSQELQNAGSYIATVCDSNCQSVQFFVTPSAPASLAFLVHPSRAPVSENDVISGVALPFDQFRNLVVAPAEIDFQMSAKGTAASSLRPSLQDGIAWFRTNSGKTAGPVQITASLSGVSARRVVQQVASDPCNLRIKGQRTAKGIVVETDPVRDCSGNPVPDGTIVTFTAKDGNEMSTVDTPIKQGVARAQIIAKGPTVITSASGAMMGNELHIGAQ